MLEDGRSQPAAIYLRCSFLQMNSSTLILRPIAVPALGHLAKLNIRHVWGMIRDGP